MLPPFWSLGFHLCRYGYNSIDNLKATIQVIATEKSSECSINIIFHLF